MYVVLKPILSVSHRAPGLTDGEGINPKQVIILEHLARQNIDAMVVDGHKELTPVKMSLNPKVPT